MQSQAEIHLCELAVQDDCADERISQGEEEMAANVKDKADWKGWVAPITSIIVAVAAATWGIAFEFSALDKHISRVETAVRIIGAKQGGDTQTLVDESLKMALNDSKAGRVSDAASTLAIANRFLAEQAQVHSPIQQQAATQLFLQYKELKRFPALAQSAHAGMLELADYHSANVENPPGFSGVEASLDVIGGVEYIHDGIIYGPHAIKNSPEGFDISRTVLKNVILRNVMVFYRGGPLHLENVTFIDCKFNVSDSTQADQLLQAAVENSPNLQIS
jgi:hypothetical protein